jgi:arylsulfatase A-like enzyme
MIDNLVRLDIQLGEFLSYLEARFGRERIFVALTADHAAIPLPEYTIHVKKGQARRLRSDTELNPAIKAVDDQLMAEFKTTEHILIERAFLNYRAAKQAGVSEERLQRMVRERLTQIDGIAEVYFRSDMLAKKQLPQTGEYLRRGYGFDRGQDFLLVFDENTLVTSGPTGTSHGSPYRYDTHIPVLFWGPKYTTTILHRRVNLVDVAPTIAGYLNIPPPNTIDGVAIPEAIQR